jgi:hypothetical protein
MMGSPGAKIPGLRRGYSVFQVRGAVLICLLLILALIAASAVQARVEQILIVRNDHGGVISERSDEIAHLQRTGQPVQIEGECLSACTMYLALQNTCVKPDTRLGFHAPQIAGQRLAVSDFEHWSQEIARHYPEPLKTWYMREGRLRQAGYFSIRGTELIRLGVPACPA